MEDSEVAFFFYFADVIVLSLYAQESQPVVGRASVYDSEHA